MDECEMKFYNSCFMLRTLNFLFVYFILHVYLSRVVAFDKLRFLLLL